MREKIEIGNRYFCMTCKRPILWTGTGWIHGGSIEEHPADPYIYTEIPTRGIVFEGTALRAEAHVSNKKE